MGNVNMDLGDTGINSEKHRIKSKKWKKYVFFILLLLVIGLIIVAIRQNIGGITSKYIGPKIKDVPVIKYVLPKPAEDPYDDYTHDQLVNMLKASQAQEEAFNTQLEDKEIIIEELKEQISNLKVFEQEHLQFKESKRIFDEGIASNDEAGFIQFYENMYPEYADDIYIDLVQKQQMNKEQKRYAALISEMDASSAAKVLENLFQTDMDIILSILSNMETESASSILEEMDSKIASTIVKQLSPE